MIRSNRRILDGPEDLKYQTCVNKSPNSEQRYPVLKSSLDYDHDLLNEIVIDSRITHSCNSEICGNRMGIC